MELSLVVCFDELRRCQDVLTDGTAEIEFRRALHTMQESRFGWQEITAEAERLQQELDKLQCLYDECIQNRSDLETKLFHARRLLESESKARRKLEKKLSTVWDYLHNDRDMDNKIRDNLASLSRSPLKRKSESNGQMKETQGNEIKSTWSLLSDLSETHIEDIFPDISKPFKKHRISSNESNSISHGGDGQRQGNACRSKKLRKKRNTSGFDSDVSEKIVATTTVSIPKDDGPIEATSTITALPNSVRYNQFEPIDTATEEDDKKSRRSMTKSPTETITVHDEPNLLFNFKSRQHKFSSRTIFWSESCSNCLKKFRFGASAFRCSFCGAYLHSNCKSQFTMVCVPKAHGKLHNKQHGYISDYVPSENPMIPPIIVYCINEIETRGLSEMGIYRKSGSEKEIHTLKERILRGKCAPLLTNSDIHVICGCIKDFLRGLKEPLIPTDLWTKFSNAVQLIDDADIERELTAAITLLPQANRDTLAFLILHLKRVANCTVAQMPISNLAKIFGPTVVGYSCADLDHHAILSDTMVQKDVMENLLKIPANYWFRFIKCLPSE